MLFFTCLADMPYGYFQFVRFIALVAFGYFAYQAYVEKKETEMFIYIGLAVLFQPLFKISLGRELWNVIDVIVGIGLIGTIFIRNTGTNTSSQN
ncbi:MAG: DUF6804 family protein [Daejeonella sp.]